MGICKLDYQFCFWFTVTGVILDHLFKKKTGEVKTQIGSRIARSRAWRTLRSSKEKRNGHKHYLENNSRDETSKDRSCDTKKRKC